MFRLQILKRREKLLEDENKLMKTFEDNIDFDDVSHFYCQTSNNRDNCSNSRGLL